MQNIFESIFDMLLWQRQNHSANHEIGRDLYTPQNPSFTQLFCFQKSFFMI